MQSVERIFTILRTIAGEVHGIGVTRLAERIQLPKGTVSRFLTALEVEGAVIRSPDNRFVIGEQLSALCRPPTFEGQLVSLARPILMALNQETQEAVGLSVLDGNSVRYIDHLASLHSVQVVDWTGRSVPLHISSSGKLFLANASDAFIADYVSTPLAYFTENTITTSEMLLTTLATVRETGVAVSDEEFADGVIGYAVPIRDKQQHLIAALTLYGPKYRLSPLNEENMLVKQLKEAVQLIEVKL